MLKQFLARVRKVGARFLAAPELAERVLTEAEYARLLDWYAKGRSSRSPSALARQALEAALIKEAEARIARDLHPAPWPVWGTPPKPPRREHADYTSLLPQIRMRRGATEAELEEQKKSFARGELAFGSDADEARERAAWRARQPKGDFLS